MRREVPRGGFEQDCIYAKNILKFTDKPGMRRLAKKRINRRERRKSREQLRNEQHEQEV